MAVRHLDFFYGKFQGLKDINLDIAERRVTAFIGPSGCGKSTLLRTLNRMYSLYPGQRAGGRDHLQRPEHPRLRTSTSTCCGRRSAWCSRSRRRFPMSIYDNIAFGVRLYENLSPARWTSASNGR